MMKFSQLNYRPEARVNCIQNQNFKKICATSFELFLISQFLSLGKICLTDFYFALQYSEVGS